MMWAPFIDDSDDQLQQLAQVQIFLTLVASTGLRLTPPDETVAMISTVCLYIIPVFAIFMETPLAEELRGGVRMLKACCSRKTVQVVRATERRMSSVRAEPAALNAVHPDPVQPETPQPVPDEAEAVSVSSPGVSP